MLKLLSRRRFEVIALSVATACVWANCSTSQSLAGVVGARTESLPSAVRRGIQAFEGRATDLKFRLRGPRASPPKVVVAAADERGVQRFGLWPWPRDVMARALDVLLDAGAKAIGLDITFSDPLQASAAAEAIIRRLDALGPLPAEFEHLRDELKAEASKSPDDALAATFTRGGRRIVQGVIVYDDVDAALVSPEVSAQQDLLIEPHLIRGWRFPSSGQLREFPFDPLQAKAYVGARPPLRRFAEAGSSLGHFQAVVDPDGAIRRAQLLVKLNRSRGLFPSMSLQVAAQMLDATIEPVVESDRLEAIELRRKEGPGVFVPMEGQAPFMLIDYAGEGAAVPTLSLVDVLDGTFASEQVRGKAVLVGVTITGHTGDQRVTPFSQMEPGVYTHAAALSNILEQRFLTRPEWVVLAEGLGLLLMALVFGAAIPRLGSFKLKAALIGAALAGWWTAALLLFVRGLNVAVVLPTVSIAASSFAVVFLGYMTVDRQRSQLRSTLTRYVGADVLEAALAHPDLLKLGEKRVMTVLFSDIRGFTTLSESMSSEVLRQFINQYLSRMTQVVFDQKGTLDKYIGDAVMAFWNAPLPQDDHALRACTAAVEMLSALEQLRVGWRAAGYPELEIGIGINTGPMVVGEMGSDVRVDYTVLGDAVNLASRLEGTNKEYGTRIILSESTWTGVREAMVTRRLGAVRVKGKTQPVGIYELRGLGRPGGSEAEAIALFETALQHWAARQYVDAEQLFRRVLALWPDDTATLGYLEELERFKLRPPPPDWDGVVTLKTK